ncbi:MAG: biotin/lipoyl-binding protein [Chloroflexi bacterium]|nr:biotin/lipoyl-binding protein [Chloroflexota bacterium]
MGFLKTTMVSFILGGLIIAASSCTSASKAVTQNQTVAVQRGNLTIDITGAGNLVLSQKEDLAFEIAGTVTEVMVTEGDTVEKGQVLAKLDTSDWETQLSTLEDKVTAAERQLTAKERAVTTAERQLTAKERDVVQAAINLKDAQTVLDRTQVTYTVAEYTAAQAAVDAARTELETAQQKLSRYEPGTDAYWIYLDLQTSAKSKLKTTQAKLDDMLSGFKDELAKNQRLVDTAQWNLESAQIAVADAQLGIEDAQIAVADTQKARDDAQKALDEAKSKHTAIIAPSAGFITKVNVLGGTEVTKGTVAVTLADPAKFEADILVNETDILQTKLGGNASVQVEAMPGLNLPAKVTQIAPTATIQSGVVNYKVKVAVASLQSVMQARQQAIGNLSADNITSPRQPTGGNPFSGNTTSPGRPTGGNSSGIVNPRTGGLRATQGQTQVVAFSDVQLREGQTVTVSILVAERSNVLLVPNGAITRQGEQSMVKVMKDGVITERSITVGISNWQYTEVTNGLTEGETVLVPQNTAPKPTTSQQNQGGIRLPGAGGFGR